MKDKKFEITQDDLRVGNTHVLRKIADHLSKQEAGGKSEDKKDFSEIKEFDLESKITAKELAEAFNQLLAVLKK